MPGRWPPALMLAFAASAGAQGPGAGFGWFAELAGSCWTASFPDGKTEHTQCYTVQFEHFLRGTAVLKVQRDGQWQVAFEGDSVFSHDTARRTIVYTIWGSDGSHRQLEAQWLGDELAFPVPNRADPGQVAYRSLWRRLGGDAFEVRRERPKDGSWSTELTVVYRRTAATR